ncbi:MAG: endonuclease/exonuclease/phosphatase family protein [Bacteroidales bacterium]
MKRLFILIVALSTLNVWGYAQNSNDTVRVMSLNILHGATMKGDFNLDAIAGFIKKYNPDLVAMQEVDFNTRRARGYNLPLELGYRTKMNPLYARAMYYDGGEYGEAILSKFSFTKTENIALPHKESSEPRAALMTEFLTKNGNTIQFVATHLDHLDDETDRVKQAFAIKQKFEKSTTPTILIGDLNADPNSNTLKILKEVFTKPSIDAATKATYPSDNPNICIDHILFNMPDNWEVIDYRIVCDDYITDHCAVVATLVYKP